MARTIAQTVSLGPIPPSCLQRWYFLMADGTMWSLSVRDGPVWSQAPAVPGSRVVTAISAVSSPQSPYLDTVYAACSDGTIWAANVTTPFTWAQVATTPA